MTALATPTQTATVLGAPTSSGACAPGAVALGNVVNAVALPPEPAQPKRVAHYLWAVLIASIYEVFPLFCPPCGGLADAHHRLHHAQH